MPEEQFKLSVYIGGSHGDLPERLVKVTEAVIVSDIVSWWDSGIDGAAHQEPGVKVAAILDRMGVLAALQVVEGWFWESGQTGILVEIGPTFLRSFERES